MLDGLKKECVAVETEPLTKEEAIQKLIYLACAAYEISSCSEITSSIMERENKLSTGIGLGIAIPHCRIDTVTSPVFAVLLAPSGIDYNSVDGFPVKLMFLIISPEDDIQGHLACLSAVSRAVSDEATRLKFINSSSPELLFENLSNV